MDKQNPSVRRYLAQRADLIGAIRLPEGTFWDNAGTKAVTDIIFLQKRDRVIETEPDWVHLGKDENGIEMNQYFIDNPEMVLGEMTMRSGQ
jgi:adenine-specific DNA methylase